MTISGSVIIEQGVTFAIIAVKPEVTAYTVKSTRFRRQIMRFFPGMPIILMSQDEDGTPHYYGRKDIVEFLETVPLQNIPWREYHFY